MTCTKNGHRCLGYGDEGKLDRGDDPELSFNGEGDAHDVDSTRRGYADGDDDSHVDQKPRNLSNKSSDHTSAGSIPSGRQILSPNARRRAEAAMASDGSAVVDTAPARPKDSAPAYSPGSSRWNQPHRHHVPEINRSLSHEQSTGDDASTPPFRRPHNSRVPYFRYFGPTAIVPGFKQMVVSVRDRRRSTGGSHSGGSPLSTQSNMLAASSGAGSDVVVEDLPAYDPNDPAPVHPLIISLVQTFFTHLGCNYPFLKQAKFMRLVKEKRVESILVDAICALSARFSDSPILTGGNDKMPRTERGQIFAQRAKAATVDTFPAPSVGAVQACLLMAYEGFGANQDSALWMYLGLAIRMAIDLGLQKQVGIQYQGDKDPWYTRHRSLNSGGASESPEDKRREREDALSAAEQREVEQERTDTFWAVFVLDRAISSGTGRPVTLREDDFELPFPKPSVDPATLWPDPFPSFLEIIRLYGRVSDVLNKIYNIEDLNQETWDKLIKMEAQLTKIYKNWDTRLQFNVNNFKTYLGFGQGTTFILLHFWFHALFIVLHQPTLMTPFGDLRSELQLLAESRELSMSSAKTICDILAFADLIEPKSFIGNPFTSQPMYIAACAFLMESSANASEAPSREGSPPAAGRTSKEQQPRIVHNNNGNGKHSRHSLLASAASQNYQRCYNSLQHLHMYWGGVKYILTALDQKSKGIWDCETYTTEEYESTKMARQESIGSPFPRFESVASPKIGGPPIAWTLAGTANSPNSSLTLMYQNVNGAGGVDPSSHPMGATPNRLPSTPPGNMVYDPIRQSLPEGGMLPPSIPKSNTSAIRNSPRRPVPRRLSDLAASSGVGGQSPIKYDMSEEGDGSKLFMHPGYASTNQPAGTYETFATSPGSMSENGGATRGIGQTNNVFYASRTGMPYQPPWGVPMGNMDAITFDSQDIDINALGLQQPDLMAGWMDYIPSDMLGIFDNPEMDPSAHDHANGGGAPS
jgi:hypothetical protein